MSKVVERPFGSLNDKNEILEREKEKRKKES
jgi:hypothetical protein